jgi:sarcosine/dimethylglycine N-methyltransferase
VEGVIGAPLGTYGWLKVGVDLPSRCGSMLPAHGTCPAHGLRAPAPTGVDESGPGADTPGMSEMSDEAALRYYEHDNTDPLPVVLDALREAGRDAEKIEIDDLAGIDEFHALGRPATMALAELAGIVPGTEVIDVGAGLGGPARFLAARFGARVTAVEPTERFRNACAELNRRAGLAASIQTVDGSATRIPVADASMEVAWMQAVAISVANKRAMADELRRVLRLGGRLAFFDSFARDGGDLHFPLPWADGPAASFVVSADELRSVFEAAGFEPLVWNEQEAAFAEIAQRTFTPTVDAERVGLARLMPEFEQRMGNLGRNVAEGRLGLLQAVLHAV